MKSQSLLIVDDGHTLVRYERELRSLEEHLGELTGADCARKTLLRESLDSYYLEHPTDAPLQINSGADYDRYQAIMHGLNTVSQTRALDALEARQREMIAGALRAYWERDQRRLSRDSGQGLAEYGLILALLAVISIAILVFFGNQIQEAVNQPEVTDFFQPLVDWISNW